MNSDRRSANNKNESTLKRKGAFQRRAFLLCLVAIGLVALGTWMFFPALSEPSCTILLARSVGEARISLPDHCVEAGDAPFDNVVRYLETERKRRGLTFQNWIVCDVPLQTVESEFTFQGDVRWLPTYVPRAYQFRRTVVLLPYSQSVERSRVAAEVCLMPWRRYASQIAKRCGKEFSIWK